MAAFDRVKSGIPEMDTALDNIRLGDNVVWRVSELSQFKLFMEPYIRQAKEDRRNIIYFRFARKSWRLQKTSFRNSSSAVTLRISCMYMM